MFRRQAKKQEQPYTASPQRPMEAVTEAIRAGARSRAEIRRETGLSASTVDAIIHHLERTGRLTLEELGSGCAGGSCDSCIAAKANGVTCASAGHSNGPVALVLTKRPPAQP